MSRIFISHSSANNAAAQAIAQWLESNGWGDYFLDIASDRGLAPGERWQEALRLSAHRCEAIVFLISPAWRQSRWCLAEFLLAKQLGKRIFGVLIESTGLDTIPSEMTAEWQLCDLVAGTRRHRFRVSDSVADQDTEISFSEDGLARLKAGLQRAGIDSSTFPWPPPHDLDRSPYRGLSAFEPEDAAVYFGRDGAIVRGLDALRSLRDRGAERLMVILGASGTGKSSFLRAGLWPRLNRDDRHFLPLPVVRAGRAAISGPTGLAASLEAAFRVRDQPRSRADVRAALAAPEGFDRLITELQALADKALGSNRHPPTVVLAIDQGEELFASDGRAEAEAFLAIVARSLRPALGPSIEGIASRQRLVATIAIRSDAFERLQLEPHLDGVARALFDIGPLAREDYKAVIEGPAARATAAGRKLSIDRLLTEQLLADSQGADALPLLAFTLQRLFIEHGGGGELRVADYDALGGVRGCIEMAVEAAFADPSRTPAIPRDKSERERLLRLGFVPWLAQIDPETDQRKRRLAQWAEIPAEAHALFERLIAARLLVRDRRTIVGQVEKAVVVEVAHEALLRQWPTLSSWLDQDADALKTVEACLRAAGEWLKNKRHPEWLVHAGERLQALEALQSRVDFSQLLGAETGAYLRACRAAEDAQRTDRAAALNRITAAQSRTARAQRAARTFLAIMALVIAAAGSWVVVQRRELGRQTSRVLVEKAEAAFKELQYDRALRFAVVAARNTLLSPAVAEAASQLARIASASIHVSRFRHDSKVQYAMFSSDGERVLSYAEDATVRIWHSQTGKELLKLEHADLVRSARFSPHGTLVATASKDKRARIWDAKTGATLATLQHSGNVSSAEFSRDGRMVVTASDDNTARVWEVDTGKALAAFQHDDAVQSAVFSPTGMLVATASNNTVRVWDRSNATALSMLHHGEKVSSVTFSLDGQHVLTGSYDDRARVWEVKTGQALVTLQHKDDVNTAFFSADGQQVLTASDDRTAKVWDANTGRLLNTFKHGDKVNAATFSLDHTLAVSASDDGTASIWDMRTGRELASLPHERYAGDCEISGDGRRLVTTAGDGSVQVWDIELIRGPVALEVHSFPSTGSSAASSASKRVNERDHLFDAVAFSPDGRRVVSASQDMTARIWNSETGKELAKLQHLGEVHSAVFSPDGRRVLTGSEDKSARLWDAQSGRQLLLLQHETPIDTAYFSADGLRVVTLFGTTLPSDDQPYRSIVRTWDAKTGRSLAVVQQLAAANSIAFSGRLLVTATEDGMAQVWDAETGNLRATLRHDAAVSEVVFSSDGLRVLTASGDKTARVWESRTGNELIKVNHPDGVFSAMFAPNGRQAASLFLDRTVYLWDTETGAIRGRLQHPEDVYHFGFSPDSKRVISMANDAVRVWDAKTAGLLKTLRHDRRRIKSVTFSPDSQRLATTSDDGTARIWNAETGFELTRILFSEDAESATFSSDGRLVLMAASLSASSSQPLGEVRVWNVRWAQYDERELVDVVCREKLNGARTLSAADILIAPVLYGKEEQDVCLPR